MRDHAYVLDLRHFEERLARAVTGRSFPALTLAPRRAAESAAALVASHGLVRLSVDALLDANEGEWVAMRDTDAAGRRSAELGAAKFDAPGEAEPQRVAETENVVDPPGLGSIPTDDGFISAASERCR